MISLAKTNATIMSPNRCWENTVKLVFMDSTKSWEVPGHESFQLQVLIIMKPLVFLHLEPQRMLVACFSATSKPPSSRLRSCHSPPVRRVLSPGTTVSGRRLSSLCGCLEGHGLWWFVGCFTIFVQAKRRTSTFCLLWFVTLVTASKIFLAAKRHLSSICSLSETNNTKNIVKQHMSHSRLFAGCRFDSLALISNHAKRSLLDIQNDRHWN